jgi:hypothetical protein
LGDAVKRYWVHPANVHELKPGDVMPMGCVEVAQVAARPIAHVDVTERSDRGFHQYGDDAKCGYGTNIRVYESSSAEAPHVWLALEQDAAILHRPESGIAHAHLTEDGARYLIERLQAWLDEIPSRWS